jgi:hypothetical protein
VLILSFSSQVTLTQADLTVVVEGLTDFSFLLEQYSLTSWKITLQTSQAISAGAQATVTITNPSIAGGAIFTNDVASGQLHSQAAQLTKEESQALRIGTLSTLISTVAVTGAAVASFSTGKMSSAWVLINSIQILGFIPMTNIELPIGLSCFLKSVLNLKSIPNLFKYFIVDDSPQNFQSALRIGKHSSLFLINGGQILTTFLLMLAVWPVLFVASKVPYAKLARRLCDISANYKWCFFIRFIIEGYLQLTFAALFQLHNASAASFNLLFNVLLAGACMALCLVVPVVAGYFIYKNYQCFNNPAQKELCREFGSVFNEFKNDKGFLSCSFYLLFFLRRLLYVGILYLLQDFPLLQVILNVLHSLVALAFLLVFQPFQEKYLNYSNIYAELCISVTFGLSGVFLLDLSKSAKSYLMWSAIGVVYSMMLVNCIVTCILMAKELNKLILKWHLRMRRKSKTL